MLNFLKRTLWISLLLALAVVWSSCGGSIKPGVAPVDHPVVTGVTVATAVSQTVPDYTEAVGTVRSANTSMISTKVMGEVREVRVKEGDRVRAGQLLMVLDDRDVAAQLEKAQAGRQEVDQALAEVEQGIRAADANRQFAQATYNRFKELYDKKSVSRQEFDEVEAKYKGADAAYQSMLAKKQQVLAKTRQVGADISTARTFLSYTHITSPQDGVVTQKMVDVGSMASPGMPLLVVDDVRHYRLEASVGEDVAGALHVNDEVLINLGALGSSPVKAEIAEIVPAVDPMTRTSTIKINLPSNPAIRSGIYGAVEIPRGTKSGIFLPRQAVRQRGELEFVMVVGGDGIAQMRLVKTNPSTHGQVEIVSGLTPGERVVVGGADRVSDGSRIQ